MNYSDKLKTLTILFVENDDLALSLTGKLIEPHVKKVLNAKNGLEAITLIDQEHPDLIITDLEMPKVDGCEMINTIADYFPKERIIVLTAYDNMAKEIEDKVYKVLIKPFDKKITLAVINDLVENLES